MRTMQVTLKARRVCAVQNMQVSCLKEEQQSTERMPNLEKRKANLRPNPESFTDAEFKNRMYP